MKAGGELIMKTKPRIGLITIGAERFRNLGCGTADGTYAERILKESEEIKGLLSRRYAVTAPPPVYTRSDAEEAARFMYNENADCAVVYFASWAEDRAWISLLRALHDIPLMLVSFVREHIGFDDTSDENRFVDFLHAGALVGFQEASGSLARWRRDMTFTAIGTRAELSEKISSFADAAGIRSLLRKCRIGLLSCYNDAMWSTYIDPYNVFMKIGPELSFLSLADLESETADITDEEADETVNKLSEHFRVLENVDPVKFRESVRVTLAMERMAHGDKADILCLNDCDGALFRHLGLRPGFAPTDPADDVVYVPEGDLGGALSTWILGLASGGKANFIEPFYIDREHGVFSGGHACCNYYWGDGKTIIARDERFAKTGWKHAGAPFAWYTFPEGLMTMLHMSENNGKMKMVAALVECLPTPHSLVSYSHADFRPIGREITEFFDRLGEIGVNQHYAVVNGDYTAVLEKLGAMCGFDYFRI